MADAPRSVEELEAEYAKARSTHPAPDPVAELEAEYQRAKASSKPADPVADLEAEYQRSRSPDPRKEPAPIPIQAAKGLAPNKPAPDLSKAEAELQDVLIEYNTWTNHPDPKGDALAQVEARRMRRAPSDKSAKITPFATGEVAERIKAATEPGSIGYRAAEALAPKWYGPAAQTERRHYWRVAESEADRQLARVVRQQMLMDQGVPKDAATIRAQAAYELGIPLLVPTQDNPRFSAGPGVDIGVSKVTDLENTFGQGVADLAAGTMDLVSETANLAKDVAVDAPMAVFSGVTRPVYEAVTGKEAPDPSKAIRDWTFGSLTNAVANALPESAAKESLRLAQERNAGMLAGSAEVRNALLAPLGVDPIDPDGDGILDVVSRLMLTQPKEEMPAPTPSGEEIVSSTVKNVASTPGIIAQGYRDILSGEREVGDVYADTMTVGSQMVTTPVMDLFASVSKSPGAQEQESSLGWFLRVPATALSGLTTTQAARIADYWLVRSGATSQRRRRVPGDPEMGFWEAHLPVIFTGNGLHDYVTTLYNGDSFTSEWMRTADTAATLPGISDALRSSLLPGGRWREGGTQLAMWADLLVPVDNLPVDVIRGTKGVVTGAGDALRARSLGMSAKESAAMGAATALPASFTHALMMSDPAYRAEWEGMTKEAEADQRNMGVTEPVAFDPDADMVRQATARAWMRRMVDRGVNPLFTDKNTPADRRALANSIREQLTMLKVRPEDIEGALAEMMGEAEAVEPAVGSVVPSVEAERLDAREAALADLPPIGTFTEAVTAAATPREKVIAGLEELAASWGMDPADPLVSRAFEAALSYYDPAKGAFRRVPEADEALLNRITDADATRALNRLRDASPAQVMENTRAFVLGAMPRWADERIPDRARVRSEIIGQAVVEGRPLDVKQVDAFLAVTDRIADALVARGVLPTRDAWYAKQTYTGIAPGSPDEVRGRGFIQIAADGNAIIGLARDANLGTLFHENAHLLRRILPAEHMEAVDAYVREQFGGWTVPAEEWFARQFESVLTTGKVSVAKGDTITAKFVDALNKALRFAADVLLKVYEGGGLPSVDPVFAKWMETFAGLKIEIEPVKADPPVTPPPRAKKPGQVVTREDGITIPHVTADGWGPAMLREAETRAAEALKDGDKAVQAWLSWVHAYLGEPKDIRAKRHRLAGRNAKAVVEAMLNAGRRIVSEMDDAAKATADAAFAQPAPAPALPSYAPTKKQLAAAGYKPEGKGAMVHPETGDRYGWNGEAKVWTRVEAEVVAEPEPVAPLPPHVSDPSGIDSGKYGGASYVHEFVEWIAENSESQDLRKVASAMKRAMPRNVPVMIDQPGSNLPGRPMGLNGTLGLWVSPRDEAPAGIVWLRGSGYGDLSGMSDAVVLHEAIHAATAVRIHRGAEDGAKDGPSKRGAKMFQKIHADLLEWHWKHDVAGTLPEFAKNSKFNYASGNISELVTYALTDADMQAAFKQIRLPGERQSLWTRFIEGVRTILGLTPDDDSALARIIDATNVLLEDVLGEEGKRILRPSAAPWEAPLAAMSASSSTKDILAAVAPLMDALDATKEERASFLAQVKGAIKNKMPVGPVATAFVSTKIRVPADVSPPPAPTLPDVLTPIPEPSPTPLPPTRPMPKAGTLKVDAYGQPRKLAGDIPFSIRKVKLADIATEGIPPGVEELARSFNADELDPTGVDPGVGAITVRKQDGKWVAVDGVRRAQALQELHRRGMAGEEPYRSILAGVQHRTSAWATGLGVKQPLGDEVFVRVVDRDVKGDTPATGLDVLGLLPQDLADATSRAGAVAQARIAASAAAIAAIVSNPSPTFQAVAPLAALRDGLLLYAQTRAAGGPPARWASQIRSRYVAVAGSKVLPVSAPSVHVAVALGSLSPEAFAAWLDGVAKGGPWARTEADIKATADLPTRHDEAIEHGRRLEMAAIEAAEAEQPVVVEPPGWIPEVGPKGGEKLFQERPNPRTVTLFSGGGLVEEGLRGLIDPVLAVESDADIAANYRDAHGEHVVVGDVRTAEIPADGVDYLHASPVCKNFSAAKVLTEDGEQPIDIETARATADAIRKAKPRVFTLENVKGYQGSEAMQIVEAALREEGYTFDAAVYNAADYGAPTRRERLLLRAVRGGVLPPAPRPTHGPTLSGLRPQADWFATVRDIVDDLPDAGVAPWMKERLAAAGVDAANVTEPMIVMGGSVSKGVPFARAGEPAPVIKATPREAHVILLPGGKVKRVTPRAMARITGLPDTYPLPAKRETATTIIGNGVPPALTRAVFGPLLEGDGRKLFQEREDGPYKVGFRATTIGGPSDVIETAFTSRAEAEAAVQPGAPLEGFEVWSDEWTPDQGSARGAVESALTAAKDSGDEALAAVAAHLLETHADLLDAVTVQPNALLPGTAVGKYEPSRKVVKLGAGALPGTMVHEAVHVITHDAITNPFRYSPEVRKAVANLTDLHTLVKGIPGVEDVARVYGLKSVDEFVAEAMASRDFQDMLREVKVTVKNGRYVLGDSGVGSTSMWDAFVKTMARILGFSDTDALGQALSNIQVIIASTADSKVREAAAAVQAKSPTTDFDWIVRFPEVANAHAEVAAYKEALAASGRLYHHRDYTTTILPDVQPGDPIPPVPTGDVVSETVGRDQPQAFYGASKDKEGVATPYGMRAVKHRAIPAFTDPSQLKRALGYRADQTRFNARDLVVRAGAYALLQQSQARNARTRFIKVGNTVSVPVTRAAAVRARALAVLGDLPARVKNAIETRPRLAVGEDAEKQPLGLSMVDAGRIRTLLNALDANGWIDALPADIAKMTVTDIAEKMTSEQFRQFHGAVLDAQSGAAPYRGRVDRYAIAANLVWEFAVVPGGWFTPVPLPRDAGWLDKKLYNARSWVGALILSTANYALAWEQSHPDMRPDIRPLYERMRREMSQLPSRLAESLEALMESKHKAATPGAMQAELEELARTLPGAVPPIGVNPRGDGDPSDLHVLRTWLFRDPPEPYGSSTSVDMDGNTVVNFVPHDFPRVGDVDPDLTSSPERPIVDLVAEVIAHEDVLNRILNPPGRRIAPEVVDLLNQARNRTLDEEGANLLYGYAHAALNAARRIGTDILTAAAGHSGSKDKIENLVDALERDGKLSGIALDAYEAFYQLRWTDPKDKGTKASIEAIVRTLGMAPKTLPAPFWVFDVLNRLNVYHLMEDFTDLALDRNYVFTLMSMTEDTGIVFKDLRDRASFAMAVKDAINAEMRGTDYVRIYGEDVKGSGEVGVNMDSGSVQSQRARYTARTIMAHMGLRPDVLAERKGYKGEMATSPVTSAWLSLPADPTARLRAVADPKTWREAGKRYGLYGRDLFVSTVFSENLAELAERNAPLAERLAVVLSNRESYAQFFDVLRDVYAQLKGSFITGGANGILAAALFGTALFGAAAVPQAAALGVAAWGLSWMPRFAGFANNSLGAVLQGVIELGFTGTAKALATGSVPAARAAYQSVRFHRSFKAVEMARTAVANIVNPRPPENVSFVAADGRVYSIADVMTISKHYGLDETQARSESAETIRRKVDRMYATYEADPSFTGKLWRVFASFFGRYKITENYRRLYEQVDVFFRYVWLVRGLQEGLRPEDAVARALRISFDYTATSQLDRWINMIGMFWMYQRRALDLTLAAVIEHPATVFSMIRFMRAQDLTSGYADLNEEYERETETVAEYGLGRFSAGYLPVAGAKTYAQKMLLVEPPNVTAIKLMMDVTTADPFMVASRANPMIAVGFNLIGTTAGGPMVSMFRRSTAESPNQWKVPARFVMLDQALNGGKLTHLFGIVPMNVEDGTAQPSDEMAQDFYVGEQGRLLWDAYRSLIPGFSTWLTDLEVTDRSQGAMDALQIEVMNAIEGKGLGERQNYGSVFVPATDVQPRLALGAEWETARRIGIAPAPVSSPAVTEARPAFSADQAMREETEMLLGQVERMRAETPEAKELRQPEEVQPDRKVGVDPNAPMGLERKR